MESEGKRIACPFIYGNGRRCGGSIVRVEAYKADLVWTLDARGIWGFDFRPRSNYHLFCSEKGSHSGYARPDSDRMKFYYDELLDELRWLIEQTRPSP